MRATKVSGIYNYFMWTMLMFASVRTPLNSIINYLEVALEEILDERARQHLQRSLQASKSLVFQVNDLLSLTEAEDSHFNVSSFEHCVPVNAAARGLSVSSMGVVRCHLLGSVSSQTSSLLVALLKPSKKVFLTNSPDSRGEYRP